MAGLGVERDVLGLLVDCWQYLLEYYCSPHH